MKHEEKLGEGKAFPSVDAVSKVAYTTAMFDNPFTDRGASENAFVADPADDPTTADLNRKRPL